VISVVSVEQLAVSSSEQACNALPNAKHHSVLKVRFTQRRGRSQRKRRGFCHIQMPLRATIGTAIKRVNDAAGGMWATGP